MADETLVVKCVCCGCAREAVSVNIPKGQHERLCKLGVPEDIVQLAIEKYLRYLADMEGKDDPAEGYH